MGNVEPYICSVLHGLKNTSLRKGRCACPLVDAVGGGTEAFGRQGTWFRQNWKAPPDPLWLWHPEHFDVARLRCGCWSKLGQAGSNGLTMKREIVVNNAADIVQR